MASTHDPHHDHDIAKHVSDLLNSAAQLQKTSSLLLAEVSRHHAGPTLMPNDNASVVDERPQSSRASILMPGTVTPPRGKQEDHSPRARIIAHTRGRLLADEWPDNADTDAHATRLSEAMLRLGMEDLDNFNTEASRLNCSNMAITATLVSAIVATFVSTTYYNNSSIHMQIVNALWLVSLLLSLVVATLCMLISEWLTWSTSQQLRDLSILYRVAKTAIRSLLMHLSIFLFFAGLIVLICTVTPVLVWIWSVITMLVFGAYYSIATMHSPFFAFFGGKLGFDEKDHRGLRVQIWTPFTLGTHHTWNYMYIWLVKPLQRRYRKDMKPDGGSAKERGSEIENAAPAHERPYDTRGRTSLNEKRRASPLPSNASHVSINSSVVGEEKSGIHTRDFQYEVAGGDQSAEEAAFAEKLKARRLRKLIEHEPMRPGRRPRQLVGGGQALGGPDTSNEHVHVEED